MKQSILVLFIISATAGGPTELLYANEEVSSKTSLLIPKRLAGKGYRIDILNSEYSLDAAQIEVPNVYKARLNLIDKNNRIVASRHERIHERMLARFKPTRWRVSYALSHKNTLNWDLEHYLLAAPKISKSHLEISFQPNSWGILAGISNAHSETQYKTVSSRYVASTTYLLGQYEHVILQRHPELQVAYLLGLLHTSHKIRFNEDDIELQGERGSSSGYMGGLQLRILTPVSQLWIFARSLYGVYSSGDLLTKVKNNKPASFVTNSFGVQYDF